MRDTILEFIRKRDSLRGTAGSADDCRLLMESLSCDASHLCVLMSLCPLAGTCFCRRTADCPDFRFEWLKATSIVEEALELFPGTAALKEGYIPIGSCLFGTGDPYFVRSAECGDPALYQIRHDLAVEADRVEDCVLLPGAVIVVLPKLEMLLDFID